MLIFFRPIFTVPTDYRPQHSRTNAIYRSWITVHYDSKLQLHVQSNSLWLLSTIRSYYWSSASLAWPVLKPKECRLAQVCLFFTPYTLLHKYLTWNCLAVGTSWVSKTSNSDSQGKADAVYTVYGKYLTGTLYGSGYNTQVAHEIDINKVVSYSVLVRSNNVFYPPNYTYTTGYNFQSLLNSIYVQINPTPNYAQYIYGQTFLIYIQYIGWKVDIAHIEQYLILIFVCHSFLFI